jgi:hypothetical protein
VNLLVDKVKLIKDNKEIVGFVVNGKEFYAEEGGRVEALVEDLKGFNISSIPEGFYFSPIDKIDGNVHEVSFEGQISSDKEKVAVANMEIHVYRKYWYHKFGATQYFDAMTEAVESRSKDIKDVEFEEIEDDGAHIFFRYHIFLLRDMPIDQGYQRFKEVVKEVEGHTERILDKEEISGEVLDDEHRFTLEILLPLFRNMGFIDVKYNHSKREYGKDITFSEIDKFGVRRNHGVQIKKGDLSGEAGSNIDEIISQIDDAFKMPYIDTTSREERYISEFLVAISGRFTNNAEEKIVKKVNQRNVYFLSIDKIQELLTTYMKKKVNAQPSSKVTVYRK